MDENCKRQKEVERAYGGLLPAVEGHSLGTRYKVFVWHLSIKGFLCTFQDSNLGLENKSIERVILSLKIA